MHGQIDTSSAQRTFDLSNEYSISSNLSKRPVRYMIASSMNVLYDYLKIGPPLA
jgi:hypothetical protein